MISPMKNKTNPVRLLNSHSNPYAITERSMWLLRKMTVLEIKQKTAGLSLLRFRSRSKTWLMHGRRQQDKQVICRNNVDHTFTSIFLNMMQYFIGLIQIRQM